MCNVQHRIRDHDPRFLRCSCGEVAKFDGAAGLLAEDGSILFGCGRHPAPRAVREGKK